MDPATSFDRTGHVKQLWVGSVDAYGLLGEVGSWHLGSYNARHAAPAMDYAIGQGWVALRTHYGPSFPDGTPAYELTDEGLAVYRWARGHHAAVRAETSREWYRTGRTSWETSRCRWCSEEFSDKAALGRHWVECGKRVT